MKPQLCPNCNAQLAMAQVGSEIGESYCPVCGWNEDEAEHHLRSRVRPGPRSLFSLALVTPEEPASAPFEYLLHLPRPRQIRLKLRGWFQAIFPLGMAAMFVLIVRDILVNAPEVQRRHLLTFDVLLALAIAAGFIALAVYESHRRRRCRLLLTEGQVAFGTVTSQAVSGGLTRSSTIEYTFDVNGRLFLGKKTDSAWAFEEGMLVPIFYDVQRPENHVALCGTYYKVLMS